MKKLVTALKIFLFLTILTGIVYPLLVTAVVQIIFPRQANGSMIRIGNQTIGSELIGQQFDSDEGYFHSRPSATSYNPLPSGGSNLGLTNKSLKEQFDIRKRNFMLKNATGDVAVIPSEMLFASASGLDPHISPEAAILQLDRVCLARNFSMAQKIQLRDLINQLVEPPQIFFMGEKRVNVLLLNLMTDKIK